MKKAIIFDLDGTLWNATNNSAIIWNRVLESYPEHDIIFTSELVAGLMGKTMPEIGLNLFPNLSQAERDRMIDLFGIEEVKYLRERRGFLHETNGLSQDNGCKEY